MTTGNTTRVEPGASGKGLTAGELHTLKARDNVTNIAYIAQAWLIASLTIALTIWSFSLVSSAALGWWWNTPVTALAIVVIGATQHQLGGVVHEGTHYMLFADRRMNEVLSDWFGAFPIYTSTYAFRLHHLAHHQFINDPERDPNFALAEDGGHWLDFPIAHVEFLLAILRQLWPPNLVRYVGARARYSALGVDTNPYADSSRPGSAWVIRLGVLFAAGAPAAVILCILLGQPAAAFIILVAGWAAAGSYYLLIPNAAFAQSRIEPVISHRWTWISRISFLGLVYTALTVMTYVADPWAWGYFLLLWVLPLFTAFPLFMILREWLQHGNGDRGRYTNSRVFFVNPLLRYAVFPFGQDYHLPHHLVAAVPHYRLKELHALLRRDPEYARMGLEVEGWSRRPRPETGRPSSVEVLGPAYTPSRRAEAHVDSGALDDAVINDAAAIRRHVEQSRRLR